MGIPVDYTNPTDTFRQLMATRNEWNLYRRKCDKTQENMIAAYPTGVPFPVFSSKAWWSDDWDALSFGRDFDFGRPFFDQFAELQHVVPREGTSIVRCENCDYNSHTRESRNCYMNSLMARCEDVYYSYWMVGSHNVMDSMFTHNSTLCAWCSDVHNGYQCVLVESARDSSDCYFSFELRNCNHCIFSNNLVNKSYYAFNKPCTKEEFERLKNEALNGSWKSWDKAYHRFLELRSKAMHRAVQMVNVENCTGDCVYQCKNCSNCFDIHASEDCSNAISTAESKNVARVYSCGWPASEVVYNSCVTRGSTDIAYSLYTWWSNRLRYSDSCFSSNDCFGCIGLRHKQYCILNKQYTKEEYEALVPRIIEHMGKTCEWGRLFPKTLSVFAYNESAANGYFPLSKEEVLAQGYRWKDSDATEYRPSSLVSIPDSIHDVLDDIVKELFACMTCKKNYRIVPQELAFYRSMSLPLPRHCPSCRHQYRFRFKNSYLLHFRNCADCGKSIQSSYSPKSPERVYCETCYLKAVY